MVNNAPEIRAINRGPDESIPSPLPFFDARALGAAHAFDFDGFVSEAAKFFNVCRSKGIQGSNTDFLICAVAVRFSADSGLLWEVTANPNRYFDALGRKAAVFGKQDGNCRTTRSCSPGGRPGATSVSAT